MGIDDEMIAPTINKKGKDFSSFIFVTMYISSCVNQCLHGYGDRWWCVFPGLPVESSGDW